MLHSLLRKSVMRTCLMLLGGMCLLAPIEAEEVATRPPTARIVVVVGAEGSAEFASLFRTWAARWEAAAQQAGAHSTVIGLDAVGETLDRDQLAQTLQNSRESATPLWLVLLGHGTFDSKVARFNMRGPDVSATDLKTWLEGSAGPVAILNCTSCSGPFLNELAATNRVVITATRSGHEYNFARFGDFLSAAITDPQADLDKDDQTSLLEAYLIANGRLREFYQRESRLATEHALLDDNGDGQGTPADWFQGTRVVKEAKSGVASDGLLAAQFVLIPTARDLRLTPDQRERRAALERLLASLSAVKAKLPEDEYFKRLEPLLVELAEIGQAAETKQMGM